MLNNEVPYARRIGIVPGSHGDISRLGGGFAVNLNLTKFHTNINIVLGSDGFHARPVVSYDDAAGSYLDINVAFLCLDTLHNTDNSVICLDGHIACLGQHMTSISGFQKLHLSVYPLAATTVEVYPVIQPEAEYHKVSETLVKNQWNDVVFDYTEKTFTAMTQLGFVLPHTAVAYFIDNVYFFKDGGTTAIDETTEPTQVRKMIENGQLVIIRDGVKYNVLGVKF